jgi:autotransporter translocation and assembly factor TamB
VYRPSREGRPVLARGRWLDEQTFEIDYSQGPGLNDMTLRLRFDGDHITFELEEVQSGVQISAEGTCGQP